MSEEEYELYFDGDLKRNDFLEAESEEQMTKQESINIKDMTDYRCKECKKDWTKCSKCPVMMKWVKEHIKADKEE